MKGLTNLHNRKINQGGIYCLTFQRIIVDELEQICFLAPFLLNITQLILTYNYNALYYYYFRRYLLMLICFICIWVGCIKGISDKILFNPISFFSS